ncbi:hypothetical protein Hanom_Chr14g01265381 [Helianthus anomalus]
MLNFILKCRILCLKHIFGTSGHYNLYLVTQFYNPHFPTLSTSVVNYSWPIQALEAVSACCWLCQHVYWVIRSLCYCAFVHQVCH